MDTNKQIAKAVLNKSFAEAKELVFKSLYARASLALDEARLEVAQSVFNSVKEDAEQLDEVSPPDMEKMTGSKSAKASFTKQYGKRGKEVMYATAWKLHNKKAGIKEETHEEKPSQKKVSKPKPKAKGTVKFGTSEGY